MNNEHNTGKFKELLDKLQQESWQLELLISGFAIFGLISAITPIEAKLNEAIVFEKASYFRYAFQFALLSCYILIINLVIHVILRGLWIGAIGLRYVSSEIDYTELNYHKRFTNYLEKKVGSFDGYIARLENYCSILFAVTFLTLFYFITAFCLFAIFLFLGYFFVEAGIFPKEVGVIIFVLFLLVYLVAILIIFIDFITQGFLKKKEWTSFLYMPIYKIFSYLTLSFLYRPLVYNFLDNKFGRRIAFILVPLYAFIFYFSTFDNVRSNYFYKGAETSKHYSKKYRYLSSLTKEDYVWTAVIQSKIIDEPYVHLFVPFKEKIDDYIFERNPDIKPQKDIRGYESTVNLFTTPKSRKRKIKALKKKDSIQSIYLKTFNNNYKLKIDSINLPSKFIVTSIKNQLGFETVLPLQNTPEGKHLLRIDRIIVNKKDNKETLEKVVEIPFWYYKPNYKLD
ncbi:hypothetical protein WH52_05395 [Tenacibaculum holothuriorum]|uniref:Uncharacterized protein n=1 Tax=Tenacibaculum holothuriorum TaxID=1635173 RepID=A0A1Y2PET0_9FLAO|nr:hypothetical protein [Tenacibaculum holothuriorum]OSY88219.1 hypothetical protein WH52_05395 [Tenacibaculum holothuriorum]